MPTAHLVNLPPYMTISITGSLLDPAIDATASYDAALRRYTNTSFQMEHPQIEISSTAIRKVPIHRRISLAQRDILADANSQLMSRPPVKSYFKGTTGRAVSKANALVPTDSQLETAAVIFHLAAAIRDTPVRSVERCFNITYRDAKRWVRRARRLGILER